MTDNDRIGSHIPRPSPARVLDVDMLLRELALSALNDLSKQCYETAQSKGFHDAPRDPGLALALIHSEVSECLEAIRKPGISEHCPEISAEGEELADIIIRVLDFAAERGIRIGEAVFAKMDYNASRPRMHGGKAF